MEAPREEQEQPQQRGGPLRATAELVALSDQPQEPGQLTLRLEFDGFGSAGDATAAPPSNVLLILAVDQSSSMGSNFARQVVPALKYVVGQSFNLPHVDCEVVLYESKATRLDLTPENYQAVLSPLYARGGTSFASAFTTIKQLMEAKLSPAALKQGNKQKIYEEVVIGFLTDGQDWGFKNNNSSADYKTLIERIHDKQRRYYPHVRRTVCHAVAFTADHDFELLDRLRREVGTEEGGFQYAEPSDGADALQGKLEALFDAVTAGADGNKVAATLRLTDPGYAFVEVEEEEAEERKSTASNVMVKTTKMKWKASPTLVMPVTFTNGETTLTLLVKRNEDAGSSSSSSSSLLESFGGGSLGSSSQGATSSSLAIDITLSPSEEREKSKKSRNEEEHQQVAVKVREATSNDALGKQLQITLLEKQLEALKQIIARLATSEKVTSSLREQWSKRLKQLHSKLAEYQGLQLLRIFKKAQRQKVVEQLAGLNQTVNQLNNLLATLATQTLGTALKARLAELSYGAQFQSASRTRRMDERQQKNAAKLKEMEDKLAQMTFPTEKELLEKLNHNKNVDYFKCLLSQGTWPELLCDELQRDIIGFGIAVSRPEVAVDDPTQLRIQDISITTVGKASFEDALKYAISTEGQIEAHGGFSHGGEMGVALRGMGREPINAWVPLFIHQEHWRLVRPQLPPVLGYLVTLDPLGYSFSQWEFLWMLLGAMVSRLEQPGERELVLLFQYHRTCIQAMKDIGNWQEKMVEALQNFLNNPESRLKDKTKSLLVLAAYTFLVPLETLNSAAGFQGGAPVWSQFWQHVLAEAVRRAADGIWKNSTEQEVEDFVRCIVHGLENEESDAQAQLSEEQLLAHPFMGLKTCVKLSDRQAEDKPVVSSKSAPSSVPQRVGGGGREATKRARYDEEKKEPTIRKSRVNPRKVIPNVSRDNTAKEAIIAKLVSGFGSFGGGSSAAGEQQEEGETYDAERVTPGMLNALTWFQRKLLQRGYPTIAALLSIMIYSKQWHAMQRAHNEGLSGLLAEIDNNAGVAPTAWIDAMKAAFEQRKEMQSSFVTLFHLLQERDTSEPVLPDCVHVIRGMVAQGTALRTNKVCREAIEANNYTSPVESPKQVLSAFHSQQAAKEKAAGEKESRSNELTYAIQTCLSTTDMLLFVGYLSSAAHGFGGSRSNTPFKKLYWQFQVSTSSELTGTSIPLGAEKLRVLLTGKYEYNDEASGRKMTIDVLDGGKAWLPGERKTKGKYRSNERRFRRVWGSVYDDIIASIQQQ
ncbi:hypothetical protein QOT17_005629 [Balamuthia mandrillaris]